MRDFELTMDPVVELHIRRAQSLTSAGDMDGALAALKSAADQCGKDADALLQLSQRYLGFGKLQLTINACHAALAVRPDSAEAYNRLGIALQKQGHGNDAIAAFTRAIEVLPAFVAAQSNRLLALHYPDGIDPECRFREHVRWASQQSGLPRFQPAPHDRNTERRLRIGYVSVDFKQHPVSYFVEPLLAGHDRNRFEVFCYSDVSQPDATTERLQKYPATWRTISGVADDVAAEIIRADAIDILIDLGGHTAGNRLAIFSRKPAPVQITYLGYPNTTGLTEMDFRITDAMADPVGAADHHHTERLNRLPRTAWCYRASRITPEANSDQLQAGVVTFGSFNNLGKLTPRWLSVWCEVLLAVPRSRLLLKSSNLRDEPTRERLTNEVKAHGIDPNRLLLLGVDSDQLMHLAAYGLVDIALDTFPYHGTTTTCEAMWMGVPVVSCAGTPHVSRVGASLLQAVGLMGLVAQSPEQYVQIAVRLAQDAVGRAQLRRTLRDRMLRSPLMDETGFVRDFESALQQMWRS